jgi:hypothetical protein
MLEKSSSPRFSDLVDEIDRELEMAVLRLLGSRGAGGTITLREAALAVGGESWRALIERARSVAKELAAQGLVEFVAARTGSDAREPGSARLRLKQGQIEWFLAPSGLN